MVVPYVITGGHRRPPLRRPLTRNVYRFLPVRLGPDDLKRIHGAYERISLKNYGEAVRFYRQPDPAVRLNRPGRPEPEPGRAFRRSTPSAATASRPTTQTARRARLGDGLRVDDLRGRPWRPVRRGEGLVQGRGGGGAERESGSVIIARFAFRAST